MTFIIDPELTNSSSVAIGNAPLFGSMTSDGTRFYQTASALAQIAGFFVSANDGSLTPVTGSPFSTGFFPRTIAIDPAGKFPYATISSSFMGTTTSVYTYTIDAASGGLTAIPGSPFAAGENPASAAVDVSERFLFVANNAILPTEIPCRHFPLLLTQAFSLSCLARLSPHRLSPCSSPPILPDSTCMLGSIIAPALRHL
jgi:DNA-binding beta-propeller fold protein YncE